MKGYALLLGTLLTGIYGYAAQAAMAADLARAGRGAATTPSGLIWYGGTLDTVIVEATRLQPSAVSYQPARVDHRATCEGETTVS
jgi:hypothetical protein